VSAVISENDSTNDSTQIARRTDETGDDSIGVWVDVGDEREVGTVTGFKEELEMLSEYALRVVMRWNLQRGQQ
jgi:hypothetical protein